ncbi:cache domain-containing protein [Thiocystis violascens]|uniref:Cache domain protein n=1 Tax=Thiocystis violascens (strain ATCC 17096 / DSM 198 / 6111) TaxID=765911 RepID=I3YAB0_THIV6|nr:cache domain-containing protein [Thiocystis violascens]AFL73928.1 Cache domain protein [Thiocystis violascens DSM 198]
MGKHRFALAGLALTLSTAPAMSWAADAASAEEVVAKVREAVHYLNEKGLAGFSDFNNNKDARWVWKDSYVFVYSCREDVMIAHPLRPDLVGKPILQMRDDQDHPLFQDLCKAGANKDGGWVEYWWPKPGEAKASRKISYAHSAAVSFKSDIQVGAGIYDGRLTPADLSKIIEDSTKPQKAVP